MDILQRISWRNAFRDNAEMHIGAKVQICENLGGDAGFRYDEH